MRFPRLQVVCLLSGLLLICLGAQPIVDDLEARLAVLHPEEPLAYFLLAEEIAYEAERDSDVDLAVRLFVLAMHLDAEDGEGTHLARSSCIALRDLTTDEDLHRLLAGLEAYYANAPLAEIQQMATSPYDVGPAGSWNDVEAALQALSEYRLGLGRSAAAMLRRPSVYAILKPYEVALGSLDEVITWCTRHPICRQCSNQRVLPQGRGGEDTVEPRLCPTCQGTPGPTLSADDLDDQLRLELALRQGRFGAWSVQLSVEGGTPLRPVDLQAVAELLGVDLSRSVWREGDWREPAIP
jgi:hypothetical protein